MESIRYTMPGRGDVLSRKLKMQMMSKSSFLCIHLQFDIHTIKAIWMIILNFSWVSSIPWGHEASGEVVELGPKQM